MLTMNSPKEQIKKILNNPREILNYCECWANGGINIVYNILMEGRGLRPIYRFIDYLQSESELENIKTL